MRGAKCSTASRNSTQMQIPPSGMARPPAFTLLAEEKRNMRANREQRSPPLPKPRGYTKER